jgi:transcriptional regulator with XRE-family HTH domain
VLKWIICLTRFQGYAEGMSLTLSRKIKATRLALGLKQGDFAALFDTLQSTVSRWENGTAPEHRHLVKLAELAGVTIEALLGVNSAKMDVLSDAAMIGYVSNGAEVLFYQGDNGASMNLSVRVNDSDTTAFALKVESDSLYPTAENGWELVFAPDPATTEAEMLNRLCVVELADGRTLIKRVMSGTKPGHYHLASSSAPMIAAVM